MRVGIVGCGFIGNIHSFALGALRKGGVVDLEVVAVADDDRAKAEGVASHHRAEVCTTDELLDRVDAVYICTPTSTHERLVVAAAERGLSIYCEKPLSTDLAGAERVAAALSAVPHQVGLVLRSAPVFVGLRRALRSGRFGAPLVLSLRDDQFFPVQGHYASSWRADRAVAGGGTLIEHSIHDVDLFTMLVGRQRDVVCRTQHRFGYDGIEDVAVATSTHDDGVVSNLVSVWHQVLSRSSTRRLEVFCEEALLWTTDDNVGAIEVQTTAGTETIGCDPPSWVETLPIPAEARAPIAMYAEASRRFLAGEDGPSSEDALFAHRVVDAAYRSAASGAGALEV